MTGTGIVVKQLGRYDIVRDSDRLFVRDNFNHEIYADLVFDRPPLPSLTAHIELAGRSFMDPTLLEAIGWMYDEAAAQLRSYST